MPTIIDSSNGNPLRLLQSATDDTLTISTDKKKFGASSIRNISNQHSAGIPLGLYSNAFGTGDFTIEFFIYFTATFSFESSILSYTSPNQPGYTKYPVVMVNPAGTKIRYKSNSTQIMESNDVGLAEWKHIAFSRSAGVLYGFVDGVLFSSVAHTDDYKKITSYESQMQMFSLVNGYKPSCYIDEFRLTIGVGRYTANFSPPTAQFDDTDPNWANVVALLHFDDTPNPVCNLPTTNNNRIIKAGNPLDWAHRLAGTVKENGIPVGAGRRVAAFSRGTLQYISSTVTKADGSFEMTGLEDRTGNPEKLFVVAFDDDGVNPNYNAVIADQIEQEV